MFSDSDAFLPRRGGRRLEWIRQGNATMDEHVRYRPGQVVPIPKLLSTIEATELRRLFDLAAETCDAAVQVLAKADYPPLGAELERLRALNDRAHALIDRTRGILC
jgi:hypothetical protein